MTTYKEYLPMMITLLSSMLFSLLLITLSMMSSVNKSNTEKLTMYECGFNPSETPRLPFSMKFFLMGMLFLIFDLEISFIFPWCTTFKEMKWIAFMTMILFLMILTMGFIYEWTQKGLDWE